MAKMLSVKNIIQGIVLGSLTLFSAFAYDDFIPCGVTRNGVIIPENDPECLELTTKYYEQFKKADMSDEAIKANEEATNKWLEQNPSYKEAIEQAKEMQRKFQE